MKLNRWKIGAMALGVRKQRRVEQSKSRHRYKGSNPLRSTTLTDSRDGANRVG
ncbi:hypothetical protein [Sphingobacterium multivorum]|uniref:hypothetical protein n=1 Tax=Sphingobacterium multivorum TaxID=28454 RepID=UPI0028AA9871|nr:hypothetical protein [Sphingobacterium multivorum]